MQDEKRWVKSSSKPRVYLAGPFFNEPQIAIINHIQGLLTMNGYSYYSPRMDSGSANLTPEQRKDLAAWAPVFKSNVDHLHSCGLILAVVEYAMPEDTELRPVTRKRLMDSTGTWALMKHPISVAPMELPDLGTTWEIGYANCLSRSSLCSNQHNPTIIGFHSSKPPEQMNLMLTHGVHGMISGFDNLEQFLYRYPEDETYRLSVHGWSGEVE